MRMKHQRQPEFSGGIFNLPNDRAHLLPFVGTQRFAAVGGHAPRQLPALRRLAIGQNQQLGAQRREQRAYLAHMRDHRIGSRRICNRDRHEGREQS